MALTRTTATPSGLGTFALGLFCLAFFAALIVGWVKWTNAKSAPVDLERANARIKKRGELEAAWTAKANEAVWIDKEKGVVQLPISDAMRGVAAEFRQKKVNKSEVKVPVAVAPPAADPKSAEPVTPSLPSAPQGADTMQFTSLVSSEVTNAVPAGPGSGADAPVPSSAPAETKTAPAPPPPEETSKSPAAPAPAAPLEDAKPAPPLVYSTPSRPPLINWTESK